MDDWPRSELHGRTIGPNGCAPWPKFLTRSSGSANLVPFPPALKVSMVNARAEAPVNETAAIAKVTANMAATAKRSCVNRSIMISPHSAPPKHMLQATGGPHPASSRLMSRDKLSRSQIVIPNKE